MSLRWSHGCAKIEETLYLILTKEVFHDKSLDIGERRLGSQIPDVILNSLKSERKSVELRVSLLRTYLSEK